MPACDDCQRDLPCVKTRSYDGVDFAGCHECRGLTREDCIECGEQDEPEDPSHAH